VDDPKAQMKSLLSDCMVGNLSMEFDLEASLKIQMKLENEGALLFIYLFHHFFFFFFYFFFFPFLFFLSFFF
jgi:hypothetical protein